MNPVAEKPAVIVVSSHVARGAVGNRAAVLALESLGFAVVAVPTVTLSWHPGEGPATRIVPPPDAFAALAGDLAGAPWLKSVGGILTGYLGEAGQVEPVAALVRAVKAASPEALCLCDPVIGDAAGLYVAADLAAAIGARLLPAADIATPNRHELEFVAGRPLADNDALVAAARATGLGEVVVTSAFAPPGKTGNLLVSPEGVHLASHPALPAAPHGTGDLLAALYLAHRLDGAAAVEALRRASGATLRLAGMAAGASELPLARGRVAIADDGAAVTVVKVG